MTSEMAMDDFARLEAEIASLGWSVPVERPSEKSVEEITRRAQEEFRLRLLSTFVFTGVGVPALSLFAFLLGLCPDQSGEDYRI